MRYLLTSLLCVFTLSLTAQVDCLGPDFNNDGEIGTADLIAFLSYYGNDWPDESVADIPGCMDDTSCNYNPLATSDDGSCTELDECGTCGGAGIPEGECDCEGTVLDECGVCGGPGPTEVVIESITILYDSLYAEQIDNWFIFEVGADTTFSYDCPSVFQSCGDLVSHEGYNYSTVQIGDQCWFAENCRYLPEVSPSIEGSETAPYYYVFVYEGTDVTAAQATANYATYGVLYNWPAVMTEGICPSGWHIPSDGEWQTMEISLGMSESEAQTGWRGTDEGYQMKSSSGWNSGGNGSNSSGLTGLAGGYRYSGGFISNGIHGYWWSESSGSWRSILYYFNDDLSRSYDYSHNNGYSARCVRD